MSIKTSTKRDFAAWSDFCTGMIIFLTTLYDSQTSNVDIYVESKIKWFGLWINDLQNL
jgi:hypothetical protein